MITGNTEVNKWRRVSAGSLTIRYTGYLTNPFSKLKSRRPPLYKGQTGQKRKHYFRRSCTGESTSTAKRAHGEAHVPLRRKSCVRTEPEGGPTAIKKDSERTNYGFQAFATSPLGVRVSACSESEGDWLHLRFDSCAKRASSRDAKPVCLSAEGHSQARQLF